MPAWEKQKKNLRLFRPLRFYLMSIGCIDVA